MEARPRKRMGHMRGKMRSCGECARATEIPAAAPKAANVNAAAMKAATAEAASTTVETAAAAMKTATTATTAAMASAASRAGIRHGGQQDRAGERGNA